MHDPGRGGRRGAIRGSEGRVPHDRDGRGHPDAGITSRRTACLLACVPASVYLLALSCALVAAVVLEHLCVFALVGGVCVCCASFTEAAPWAYSRVRVALQTLSCQKSVIGLCEELETNM